MSTNKKNQHYIPKFYLRNFSFQKNNKQIGLFNIINSYYFETAPIKSQGSKDFFYGKDGKIEGLFSIMECEFAKYIRNIVIDLIIPARNSKEHIRLLEFVAISDLRNPIIIDYAKQTNIRLKEKLEELHPGKKIDESINKEITHEEAVKMSLRQIKNIVNYSIDLEFKLLINKTNIPFITSDYSIVKYNQFMEMKKYIGGKTGYGSKGLQIIIPISPDIILFFYDSEIYKVGYRKRKILEINEKKDVDQLNLLQFLNCKSTLYFNEKITKYYLDRLFEKSRTYKKANILQPKVFKAHDFEISKSNYISFGTSDCEIALNLQGIKYISGVKDVKLPNSMAIYRSNPELLDRYAKR